MRLSQRLEELGISLPEPVAPVAAYQPATYSAAAFHGNGGSVITSGQLPMRNGELIATGRVRDEVLGRPEDGTDRWVDPDLAYECARQCAINALAAAVALVGDPDRIVGVIKVTGFVASSPDFTGQPRVLNGVSEFYGEVFGGILDNNLPLAPQPGHARSAVGVAVLPLNVPVEVEVEFLLDAVEPN